MKTGFKKKTFQESPFKLSTTRKADEKETRRQIKKKGKKKTAGPKLEINHESFLCVTSRRSQWEHAV